MKLKQILQDLTYGELAGLKFGNLLVEEAENEPDPHQYERIISYINLGLTEIYKRFFLRSREIYIQEQDEVATYKLHSDYAASNTASAIPIEDRYIIDTADDPFLDDILKIEEVYDEEGNKMSLNDITDDDSAYTPAYNMVQIPYPDAENTFAVQYRAAHPRLDTSLSTDPDTVEVELPNSLYAALLQYVGYRAYLRTNAEKSADFWQQFEKTVQHVDRLGLEVQGEPGDWRFDEHGWV